MQRLHPHVRSVSIVVLSQIPRMLIVMLVIPHVTIVDTQDLQATITHTLVLQVVVTDVEPQDQHLTAAQMLQHRPYVRSALTAAHRWMPRMHTAIHAIPHATIADTPEVHLIRA